MSDGDAEEDRLLRALNVPPEWQAMARRWLGEDRPLVRLADMLHVPLLQGAVTPSARIAFALGLRRAAPRDRLVWNYTHDALAEGVPDWHWAIVSDAARNRAYDAALRAAVGPDDLVLDIGAGTGLLSMMAARAGARVHAVELSPVMAAVARDVVALNGLSDRIEVHEADALALGPGDLPRARVLVQEVISTNLVGQNLVALVNNARRNLLTPDAALLPCRVRAEGRLIADPDRPSLQAEGFDLGPLSGIESPSRTVAASAQAPALSTTETLMEIDLAADPPPEDGARAVATVAALAAGDADAVEQWPSFVFPDGTRFDGAAPTSCWGRLRHRLGGPLRLEAGETAALRAERAGRRFAVSLDVPG